MKVCILEDEPLAADKLSRYLQQYDGDIEVLIVIPSLEKAIPWIIENADLVDIFFMDVQLQDGLCFEVFSSIDIKKPVVFTTAFDEYAIDAFRVNSIDYLLKPINFTGLSNAMRKLARLRSHFTNHLDPIEIAKQIQRKKFKERFLVQMGNHINSVATSEIAYFFAEGRDVFLVCANGRKYLIEFRLEVLEEILNPKDFYRINRSFVVGMESITDVIIYSNRRLKLSISPHVNKEVVVSREKVSDFKTWLSGEA